MNFHLSHIYVCFTFHLYWKLQAVDALKQTGHFSHTQATKEVAGMIGTQKEMKRNVKRWSLAQAAPVSDGRRRNERFEAAIMSKFIVFHLHFICISCSLTYFVIFSDVTCVSYVVST